MQTLLERFEAKVNRSGECWLWLGYINDKGYGSFSVEGKPKRAHRVSYELFVGEIPEGLELDHLCHTNACVNPKHLEAVTHQVNMSRQQLTGRYKGWTAKYSPERRQHIKLYTRFYMRDVMRERRKLNRKERPDDYTDYDDTGIDANDTDIL